MNADRVDRLIGGLAAVRDETLLGAAGSAEARLLFQRIVSTPAPRPRHGRRVLIAALVAAALVAAPAVALRGHIVHLFSAREPASPDVTSSFYSLEDGAPPQFRISGPAKKVLEVSTPDGPVAIWAAPREVGFCYAVGTAGHEGYASTCVDDTTGVEAWPFTVEKPDADRVGGPFVLAGYTNEHAADSIRVRFDDGTKTDVPITWISAPIDAGFFVLWTPKSHWLDGKERFEVFSMKDGKSLSTSAVEVGVPTG